MKPTFHTMTLQRVMITGRGHCVNCNALAPYHVRYGPFLKAAYCWRHLPLTEVPHIRDHPQIRDRPDIMRRIYNAGHRPTFPRKEMNSDDKRAEARAFYKENEGLLEGVFDWKRIRQFMEDGLSDDDIIEEANKVLRKVGGAHDPAQARQEEEEDEDEDDEEDEDEEDEDDDEEEDENE